ncbi:ABC transporter ATP-binding protein [Azospirillum sp. ST 5-10]|uniref:ABC transporter ATP-binding protein n=1 Tax=unclassified Azospirillum TaxID=2630922 RepID=UPI003F49BFF3
MLRVEGLRSAYGRVEVLKGVDLAVAAGEVVALVGSNGAGKTTLLRAISGVQPITAGRIRYDGEAIERLRASQRVARGIAQSPEGRQVFGPLTVEQNLRLGAYARRDRGVRGDMERVYALFPALAERRGTAAGALSGGQQQMLAIGRALMARPRLLLLDEPSLGLSPLLVDQVFDAIAALRADGVTMLLVEQNAAAALAVSDRGYLLRTGEIVQSGAAAALLDDPAVQRAYLGM